MSKIMQYIQTSIENIEDFLSLPNLLPGFVFRGQKNSEWGLTTSLERALGSSLNEIVHLKDIELDMLRRYKQRRHLYTTTPLEESNTFEWMAELQHFGAPTRLLDFSYSPYIAAYFATCHTEFECSIWAINHSAIRDHLKSEKFRNQFGPTPLEGPCLIEREMRSEKWNISSKFVVAIESSRPNIRIVRQQGLFIAQIATRNIDKRLSFEECLAATFESTKLPLPEIINFNELKSVLANSSALCMIKINITLGIAKIIRTHLSYMGINAESLFPGLEGLALSLFQND